MSLVFCPTDYLRFSIMGWTQARFTQLKRYQEFDDCIMLVWDQEFAAGPAGSQDSLLSKSIPPDSLVITIQKKYSLTYLRRTVS